MNLIMSGLDFNTANLNVREAFHIDNAGALAGKIRETDGISGCVIISTCNRTEIYISAREGEMCRPEILLSQALGCDAEMLKNCFVTRKGDEAIWHLLETAAGLKSQILGDDQILTQLKSALNSAREAEATDAILETLFRSAITAGKRVKTDTTLGKRPASAAYAGIEAAERYFTSLTGKRAIVIGNGEMGKLAAELLIEKGAYVTMTLREYKYKPVTVPDGCKTIQYSHRFELFSGTDMVISATRSPHYTVRLEEVGRCEAYPKLFIDLAVPRDIEPSVTELGVTLYNIDSLGGETEPADKPEVCAILTRYNEKFLNWLRYRA